MRIELKDLTDKQRQAWNLRFTYGWRMKRIALSMGTSEPAVSRLLRRAQLRAGLGSRPNVRVIRQKPRWARVQTLSDIREF